MSAPDQQPFRRALRSSRVGYRPGAEPPTAGKSFLALHPGRKSPSPGISSPKGWSPQAMGPAGMPLHFAETKHRLQVPWGVCWQAPLTQTSRNQARFGRLWECSYPTPPEISTAWDISIAFKLFYLLFSAALKAAHLPCLKESCPPPLPVMLVSVVLWRKGSTGGMYKYVSIWEMHM